MGDARIIDIGQRNGQRQEVIVRRTEVQHKEVIDFAVEKKSFTEPGISLMGEPCGIDEILLDCE
mgnify:CR=1 FL=1